VVEAGEVYLERICAASVAKTMPMPSTSTESRVRVRVRG